MGEAKRQAAEKAQQDPADANTDHPLFGIKTRLGPAAQQRQRPGGHEQNADGV